MPIKVKIELTNTEGAALSKEDLNIIVPAIANASIQALEIVNLPHNRKLRQALSSIPGPTCSPEGTPKCPKELTFDVYN